MSSLDWKHLHSTVTFTPEPDYWSDPNWPRRSKRAILDVVKEKMEAFSASNLATLAQMYEDAFWSAARYRLENGGCRQ